MKCKISREAVVERVCGVFVCFGSLYQLIRVTVTLGSFVQRLVNIFSTGQDLDLPIYVATGRVLLYNR
jgi:hypothetical protein